MIREAIKEAIIEVLQELGSGPVSFTVERSDDFSHGDYATNVALKAMGPTSHGNFSNIFEKNSSWTVGRSVSFTEEFKNPRNLAEKIKEILIAKNIDGVKKIEVAGPGFINFTLAGMKVKDIVHEAHEAAWGSNDLYKNKIALVEYTSPNLFKPLHIGNLIGNILGESIARILENSGAEVKRINYPSDIGLTIAKGVWGLQKLNLDPGDIAQLGKAYVAGNEAYDGDEAAKKEIEEINKALYENSNIEWSSLREKGIATSLKHLHELCERLGTTFDAEFFESQSGPVGAEIVRAHLKDVFEESEGAVVFKGEKEGLHTRVFLNSQGLPTYEAKELGLFELKNEAYPEFDISLTVTGSEQRDFFKVVFAAIRNLFKEKVEGKRLEHIPTSFLKLTTGKMSSRKGNVITGESLLEDLTKAARGREEVAVGATKYAVLKSGSGKDIIFDPEKSLSLEGDSGPYVQYALVRARALLRNAAEAKVVDPTPTPPTPIERLVVYFPDVVERAAHELEPHYITTYVTELAGAFNSWYASERMIVDGAITSRNLAVIKAIENTLARGLTILGIPTPEEM
ncbi:MAG TPA: arginine--tRNA ligase [Candidatus Paceibacterota bacterium]|nr:arginine--tRNA ligase [Candidatus Paceibacterota bacterium]